MRIIQINTTAGRGSHGKIAMEISSTLSAAGHESLVAFGRGSMSRGDDLYRIGNRWNVYGHVLATRTLDAHAAVSGRASAQFLRMLEDWDPDVIHLHNIHGYYLHAGLLFSFIREKKIPLVWTLHDCWPFTGHCSFFDNVDCDKWKHICQHCPNLKGYPASWILDRSTHNFRWKQSLYRELTSLVLVSPSRWLRDLLKESMLGDYPARHIPNGIDLDLFAPGKASPHIRKTHDLEDCFSILGVANRWDERKGLKDFIRLSKMVPANTRILLLGLSKKQLAALPDNISGLERTNSQEELARLYASVDLFLNPTYVDNFPTTNLEALASGTPVLTYDTGGSPEAIDDGTGFVVRKGDMEGILDAIERVKSQGEQMRKRCRERTVAHYSKVDRNMDYLQLYQEILNKKV